MMQSTSMQSSVMSLGNVAGLRPRSVRSPARQPQRMAVKAAAGAAGRVGGGAPTGPQGTGLDFVPDRQKRTVMNLLLVGALGLPGTALLGPFVYFFVPKRYRTTLSLPYTTHAIPHPPPRCRGSTSEHSHVIWALAGQRYMPAQRGTCWWRCGCEGCAWQRRQGVQVAGVSQGW